MLMFVVTGATGKSAHPTHQAALPCCCLLVLGVPRGSGRRIIDCAPRRLVRLEASDSPGVWGTARVSPVLFKGPKGPDTHDCTVWLGARHGQTRARGPSPCARIRAALAMTAGTRCRDARGLSSEQGKRGGALRMLAPKRVLAVPHTCSRIRLPPAREREKRKRKKDAERAMADDAGEAWTGGPRECRRLDFDLRGTVEGRIVGDMDGSDWPHERRGGAILGRCGRWACTARSVGACSRRGELGRCRGTVLNLARGAIEGRVLPCTQGSPRPPPHSDARHSPRHRSPPARRAGPHAAAGRAGG